MTFITKFLTAVFAFSLLGVGSLGPNANAASKDPVIIGVEAPITGDQASNGQDIFRGVKLAVKQANAKGGVLNRKIKLIKLDDKASPDLASVMVKKAQAKKVVAVVGPYNSGVGIINLPQYVAAGIVPLSMASDDDTIGYGSTVQPMVEQIAPVEIAYIKSTMAKSVAMLVDPSDYTQGIADSVKTGLESAGITVTQVPVSEDVNDYSAEITRALSTNPDLLYSSTYFPEGSLIAKSLESSNPDSPKCLMGLANVDPAFVTTAGIKASQRCLFDGVPEAPRFPGASAKAYTKAYKKAFGINPGVWGIFSYDSANVLFAAIQSTGGTEYTPVFDAVRKTANFAGATGSITIAPATGVRNDVPLFIMTVNNKGKYVVQP